MSRPPSAGLDRRIVAASRRELDTEEELEAAHAAAHELLREESWDDVRAMTHPEPP